MGEKLAHGLLVNRAVLAHVQRRQMEAEHLGGAAQAGDPPARQIYRAVLEQRIDQHIQVGDEFLRRGIGLRMPVHRRQVRDFVPELSGGGGEARINQDQRAAVGFVGARGNLVRRSVGEFAQCVADLHQMIRQAQAPAEDMRFAQVMLEGQRGMLLHRIQHHIVGDERVAVAVAADPAADAQQRRNADVLAEARLQLFFQIDVNLRDFVEEGVAVILQTVLDFVAHGQPRGAQHARLPQNQHEAVQRLLVLGEIVWRHVHAVAVGQQARNDQLAVEDAFALHFGGMRGQYRRDQRAVQEGLQVFFVNALFFDALQRQRQAAVFRRAAGLEMGAMAAVVVQVFGDVGQLREVAEGAHHDQRFAGRQRIQHLLELHAVAVILRPAEAYRGAAHVFDQLKGRLALLLAQRLAEDAAEQAHVFAQRQVLAGEIGGSGNQIHTKKRDAPHVRICRV